MPPPMACWQTSSGRPGRRASWARTNKSTITRTRILRQSLELKLELELELELELSPTLVLWQRHLRLYLIFYLIFPVAPAACRPSEVRLREK
jgi:hypothetical protein